MVNETRKQRQEREFDYRVLQHGISSGRLKMFTDFRVFNQGRSPTYSPWDNVAPLLIMVLISLGLLVVVGIIVGVLALVLSVVLYAFFIRLWVMHRLHERTRQAMMQNLSNWDLLWRMGGVVLSNERTGQMCHAPNGNWRAFVTSGLADIVAALRGDADMASLREDGNLPQGKGR
ncbi:MAG: hypothetical protein JXQ84_08295 [Rhodospirillaceae bacterium]|nr:hypothetical protein [Rhodospirillaceae bacterium]